MSTVLQHSNEAGPNQGRRYDIDTLRVLAFGLLILYHCGMFYVADWGWHVKSEHLSDGLKRLMILSNQWRMELLFLISGMAVAFMLEKYSAAQVAGSRIKRLLPPLLFGMVVVVAPQAYFQGSANGAFDYSYWEFYTRYLSLQPWPVDAFDGWDFGWTWNHLWFLPYALAYSLIWSGISVALRWHVLARGLERLRSASVWPYLALACGWLFLLAWQMDRTFDETHNFFEDWYLHAQYFSIFSMGFVLSRAQRWWQQFSAKRWFTLVVALLCYGLILWGREVLPEELTEWDYVMIYAVLTINACAWLATILGWSHRYLNRPWKWLPYATEAVFPWYILHQTLTVSIGYGLARWSGLQNHWAPVLEPILLVSLTILGCLVLHEFVIRRVNILRPLFGLRWQKKTPLTVGVFQQA